MRTSSTSRDPLSKVCRVAFPPLSAPAQLPAAVFEAVSAEIPYGLVPQENTIFGAVTETYDALRGPAIGKELFVRGEVTLPVQHCLMARKGVKFEDIERIISHEQVRNHPSRSNSAVA